MIHIVQLHHPLLAPDIYLFAAVSFNVGAPLQSVRSVTRFSIVELFVHISEVWPEPYLGTYSITHIN